MSAFLGKIKDAIEASKQELRDYIGRYDTPKIKERLDSLLLWEGYYEFHNESLYKLSLEELLEFAINIDDAIYSIVSGVGGD